MNYLFDIFDFLQIIWLFFFIRVEKVNEYNWSISNIASYIN